MSEPIISAQDVRFSYAVNAEGVGPIVLGGRQSDIIGERLLCAVLVINGSGKSTPG